MVPLCSRNAHDQNVLVRRAQWANHSAHDLKEPGGGFAQRTAAETILGGFVDKE